MIHHTNYNPNTDYLKSIVASAGLTQAEVYTTLGIGHRTWHNWMSKEHPSKHSYCVQVAVEALVRERLEQSRCEHRHTTASKVVAAL